jgi:hypothetical protein
VFDFTGFKFIQPSGLSDFVFTGATLNQPLPKLCSQNDRKKRVSILGQLMKLEVSLKDTDESGMTCMKKCLR